jgi:thiol:disulfide interchange protein
MKALKSILIVLLSFCTGQKNLYAQMTADNSKWTFEAKKKTGNQYELIAHLSLPEHWHIYSFKPGGDGSLYPPAITFTKNGKLTLDGKVKEKGKLISEKLEGIDGIVNMYKGKVDYIQSATISGNTKITGTYSYQICNDEMCLPPKTQPFSIEITDAGGTADTTTTAAAQNQPQSHMIADNSKWTFEAKKKNGNQYELIVHASIPEPWHIYSSKPGDNSLYPSAITFDKNGNLTLDGEVKEKGKLISKKLEGADSIVNFYEGDVDFIQSATIAGNTKITGTYSYQVCDSEMCLPPKQQPFSIEIKDAGSPPQEKKSLLWLFLAAMGGGIAAVLTPCVYSMIPITVSFFTKRSKTRAEGIRNAFSYSLSIIIIFTVLGVLISAVFGSNALNSLSTNWIANLFFFIIFVIFGISFLGAFEITLPASWTSKTDSKAGVSSFGGIFFMALTLAIVSFSCTGPIVGPLLVLAGKGGIAGPTVGMFGFSLGLAFPFALFAIFPGWLNKMASSGGWLNEVKVVLGFVELMLALKFLSNADLAMGWRLLDREVFIALWIVISILLGFYLLGKIKFSHDDAPVKNIYGQEYISILKLFLAIATFSFTVYLLPGMWGAPLNGMSAFIPPLGTFESFGGSSASAPTSVEANSNGDMKPVKYVSQMKIYEPPVVKNLGLVTFFDYDEALVASKKLKKPIMLDFTGINCVNCRKMESQVWSKPEVAKLLKEDFIVVSLYCDINRIELPKDQQYFSKDLNSQVTTLGNKNADLQASKFGSNSQPFYFYVDENGNKLADEGYSYNPDVTKFVAHLEKVKENYKKTH